MSLTSTADNKADADFDGSLAGSIETWVKTEVVSQDTDSTTIKYTFAFDQGSSYSDNQQFTAWINGSQQYDDTFTNDKGAGSYKFYVVNKQYGRPLYGQAATNHTARARVDGIYNGPTSDTGTQNTDTDVPARAGQVLGAPGSVGWAAATSSTLTFSWSAPASTNIGPAPDNYRVQLATDPGMTNLVVNGYAGNVGSWQATGLPRATTYYFRVLAHNSVGDGAFSGVVGATTSPTVPDQMSAPIVSAATTGGFTAAFSAPNNGGSGITSYTIELSTDNFATVSNTISGISSSPRVITGLSPGTKYKARVKAINGVGASTVSTASAEIQTLGGVKVWNGSAWIEGIVRTWNGSSWVVVVVRKWNGSSWVV